MSTGGVKATVATRAASAKRSSAPGVPTSNASASRARTARSATPARAMRAFAIVPSDAVTSHGHGVVAEAPAQLLESPTRGLSTEGKAYLGQELIGPQVRGQGGHKEALGRDHSAASGALRDQLGVKG